MVGNKVTQLIGLFGILSIFLLSCEVKKEKVIGIQPFDSFEVEELEVIVQGLTRIYGKKVVLLPKQKLPKNAFVNIKTPRYRADSLLDYLDAIRPDSIDVLLGLTDKDISMTKKDAFGNIKMPKDKYRDWGIFGLGRRPGKVSVLSVFRLRKAASSETYTSRLQKIAIHEVGHNLGLRHCPTSRCVMQDAVETIRTVDSANAALCARCEAILN